MRSRQIFGPGGEDIVFSGEFAQDRQHAANFVAEAREKKSVSVDPKSGNRAFLLVGNEDWPFPVPIVKRGDKWSFDAKAGRQELLYRRIGANELDAIAICHGYVEAQHDYAFQTREGYEVNQYAQRIISTPRGFCPGGGARPSNGVTGVRTFIVSHDGVVYDRDFGPKTLDEFKDDGALQSGPNPGPRSRTKRNRERGTNQTLEIGRTQMAIAIAHPITQRKSFPHGRDSRPVSGKRRSMFATSSSRTTSRTRETSPSLRPQPSGPRTCGIG